MKKIYSLLIISLFIGMQCFGQQYINLYQDDVLIKQLSTEEIDSMSITETEPHIINFWYDGEIFLNYNSAGIDSITITNKGGAPFSYAGIVGFNSELKTKGLGILSPSTKSQYESFVNNLSCKDGTILYYAVDSVLNILDKAYIETPLQSVHVITFTDGLDQGSLMLTDKYGSSVEYLNALSERIPQTQLSGLSPQFYSVGLRGSDVSNIELFRQNLKHLASSDANAFEVSDISNLSSKFNNIANQIINVSTRQAVSVKVPGVENGTRMRFVFDNKTAENSQLYIEGTLNLQDRCLHDVVYQGIKAVSGKTVQGTQDGIFLTYTFTGMRPESGTSLIPTSSVKHYNKYPSSTTWQINSEFSPASSSQQNVSHSGTAIFLIVDCSQSLKSQFSLIKQYAKEFLNQIANNAEPFELLAPTNFKAVLDENRLFVNLSWDAVKYAHGYRVSDGLGKYIYTTDNSYTDESPRKGYNSYEVCAVGYGQVSPKSYSNLLNVTLANPTGVKAEVDSLLDGRYVAKVSWDTVKYAQYYKVYRCINKSSIYELVADSVTTNSWTDESLLQGWVSYKIYAVGYGQTSSQGYDTSLTFSLAAPTNVKAELKVNNKGDIVHVSWDKVKYAHSYKVYRSSSHFGTYALVADNLTTNRWTDESPLKRNNYYKVIAINKNTESILSNAFNLYYGEHEYVDLGLPSGTLWATCNIGANRPEETGDHFDWGDTSYSYYRDDYKWGSSMWGYTKYNDDYYDRNGFTDNKTELDPEDDAARLFWGSQWRMPTRAEFLELLENTTSEWINNYNGTGKNGCLFTASNGKFIFLPTTGHVRPDVNAVEYEFACGYYWSSTLYKQDPRYAYSLYLYPYESDLGIHIDSRIIGYAVRPVRPKN